MDNNTLNDFINAVLEEEKKEFQPGLETFQMHAVKIRQEITDSMKEFEKQYSDGFATISENLEKDGLQTPSVRPEALAIFDDPIAFQNALEQGKEIYQLLEFSPDTMKKFFEVALNLVKNGDFDKAKDVFYFLVTIASQTAAFWLGLGYSNAKIQNYEEARGAFRQVIDLDPKNGDAYLGCMNALLKKNASDEALKVCEEGLAFASAHKEEEWGQSLEELLVEARRLIKQR